MSKKFGVGFGYGSCQKSNGSGSVWLKICGSGFSPLCPPKRKAGMEVHTKIKCNSTSDYMIYGFLLLQ